MQVIYIASHIFRTENIDDKHSNNKHKNNNFII
jgi:hypothetical protein